MAKEIGKHALLDSLDEAIFAFLDEANVLLYVFRAAAADPGDAGIIPTFVVQFLHFTGKQHGALAGFLARFSMSDCKYASFRVQVTTSATISDFPKR